MVADHVHRFSHNRVSKSVEGCLLHCLYPECQATQTAPHQFPPTWTRLSEEEHFLQCGSCFYQEKRPHQFDWRTDRTGIRIGRCRDCQHVVSVASGK